MVYRLILLTFLYGDHLGPGIQADCKLICIAGASPRKVQYFDLQILSVLCVVRGHSVFTGCECFINRI